MGINNGNDSMMEMFLFEMSSLLDQLDEILLVAEKSQNLDEDAINEIFRIMHTIKGSSSMMDYNVIATVTHKTEDLFYFIRDNGIDEEHFTDLFDLILEVSDFLKEQLENIQNDTYSEDGNADLTGKVLSFLETISGKKQEPVKSTQKAKPAPGGKESETELDEKGGKPEKKEKEFKFLINVLYENDIGMENLRAFMLLNNLKNSCDIIETTPENVETSSEAADYIIDNGFSMLLATDLNQNAITSLIQQTPYVASFKITNKSEGTRETGNENSQIVSVKETVTEVKNNAAPAKAENGVDEINKQIVHSKQAAKQNIINVNLNKLDELMNIVSEIVITESMVTSNPAIVDLNLDSFNKNARQLKKLTNEMQDMVMSMRMLPIAGTFQKMQRIVRDMNKKLDKETDLVIVGEETEVDKTILDEISDPIMHLVRNSMDHGLETKEDRAKTNKPACGKITLSANNNGGEIVITISDDGKGLDSEYILNKAKSKGLLTKPAAEYSEREAFNLLTLPGFSTKEVATEFSGRGVGLDVVKKNVEKVGGTVLIDSKKGEGTSFFLKIPLTLAIVDSMKFSIGKNIYNLPITSIQQSFKPLDEQIIYDNSGNEMIILRDKCYPVVRLHKLYGLETDITNLCDGILLLIEAGDRSVCLFADQLVGQQSIVVKPFPGYLNGYDIKKFGLSGCTILGDGSISLILDAATIIQCMMD